jgi:UDP-glucose 4-epimerase
MNILISGGCGFIGHNLIKRIRKKVNNIIIIDNESLGKKKNIKKLLNKNVKFYKVDICNFNSLRSVFKKNSINCVVHLAAHTRVLESIKQPQKTFKNNIIGSFNLLELSREFKIKRFINASTGGAIMGEKKPPISEKMFPNPISIYGGSKFTSEILCDVYKESYNLNTLSLRFSNIYGPNSFHKESVVSLYIKKILKNKKIEIFGDGEQSRDFLYIDDLTNIINKCIYTTQTGAFQLGTGKPTTINTLIKILKKIFGSKKIIVKTINKPARHGEVKKTWCDISKARNILGYRVKTNVNEGIKKTVNFFLDYENN